MTQGSRNTLKHGVSLLYHLLQRTASSDFIFPREATKGIKRATPSQTGSIYLSYFTTLYWIFFNITLYRRARRPTTRTQTPFVTGRRRLPWRSFLIHAIPRLRMSMPVCSVDLAARLGEPLLVDEHPVLEPALTLPPPVVKGMGPPDVYAR
jgi:hypothetical protein